MAGTEEPAIPNTLGLTVEQTLGAFKVDLAKGLSPQQVSDARKLFGPNGQDPC